MKRCLACQHIYDAPQWQCPACGHMPHTQDGYGVFAPELAQGNDTYQAEFFATLASLEQGHFWFEGRNALLLWALLRYFPHSQAVLEIGCGTGFVLQNFHRHLPSADLSGSDIFVEGLQFAHSRIPSATFLQMDACDMPYHQAFDLIGAFDVIEHIDADTTALAQMYASLKPGGGLLISVPQHQFLWSVVDERSYHKRRYSKTELVTKVREAGFEVIKTTSFVSLLLPFMLLTRARKADIQEDFDLFAEFKLSPVINKALRAVMHLEATFIRAGMTFPLGGSRLIVAKRPLSSS